MVLSPSFQMQKITCSRTCLVGGRAVNWAHVCQTPKPLDPPTASTPEQLIPPKGNWSIEIPNASEAGFSQNQSVPPMWQPRPRGNQGCNKPAQGQLGLFRSIPGCSRSTRHRRKSTAKVRCQECRDTAIATDAPQQESAVAWFSKMAWASISK